MTGALTPPSAVRSRHGTARRSRGPRRPRPARRRVLCGAAAAPPGLGNLASRGVGLDAAVRLCLGYSPGSGLRQSLESLGFSENRLRDSGLFMERGSGAVRRDGGRSRSHRRACPLACGAAGRRCRPDSPGSRRFRPQAGAWSWASRPAAPWAGRCGGRLRLARLPGWGLPPSPPALGTQGVERVASASLSCRQDDAGLEGRRAACGPAWTPRRHGRPFPRASATWPSLRPFPTAAPPSPPAGSGGPLLSVAPATSLPLSLSNGA